VVKMSVVRMRGLLLIWVAAALTASETRLELPDPLIQGAAQQGKLVVVNPAASVADIKFPAVDGIEWQVLGGRMHQTSIVNGTSTVTESIPVAITAANLGRLEIPPVTVALRDGSTLKTAAVTTTVTEPNRNLRGTDYAEAAFEPSGIVPGEPTTLTVRLYLRAGRDVRSIKAIDTPQLPKAIAIGKQETSVGQTADAAGNEWNVVTVRSPVTFAEPGSYQIAGQVTYVVEVDAFPFGQQERRQSPLKAATLTVSPLPQAGRPDDFSGLIGPVTVEAKLERERISAGEGTTLVVTVRGRQVDLVSRPKFPAMPGVQVYDRDRGDSGSGTRTFAWDLVPSAPGDYRIPDFSFPYFDPVSHTYARGSTPPLTLSVLPGRNRTLTVGGERSSTPAPTKVIPSGGSDIRIDLPPPFAGSAPRSIASLTAMMTAAIALAIGLVAGLAERLGTGAPRIHRGKSLAKAVGSGDLARMAQALQELEPHATDDPQRAAARALAQAIDNARFGGRTIDYAEVRAHLSVLESVA
jgi:hypothetical protein